MVILKNAEYLTPSGEFVKGDIFIKADRIYSLRLSDGSGGEDIKGSDLAEAEIIDLEGKKVIPGLIDMHTHGALGYDAAVASAEEIYEIAKYQAQNGTTTFMPTTVTDDISRTKKALEEIKRAANMQGNGATIAGVHIEGPYINVEKKGAHDAKWIKTPSKAEYDNFREILGSLKVHITIAPEVEGGLDFIKYVRENGGTVGIGHSNGDYEIIMKAIEAGANIFTHLFNAMGALGHREPGVAGAALSSDIPVELICDGIHVHPAIIKVTARARGAESIVLVTDSIQAAGLGDGEYEFAGSKIYVKDGYAGQEDGTLVGSVLCLFNAVRNMIEFAGVSLQDAVRMASLNPAKVLGIDDEVGTIEEGKRADLVVLDDDMQIDKVFCRGIQVR